MKLISAQVSLYPLHESSLSEPIEHLLRVLGAHGLEVRPGPMSTLVVGSTEAVFEGLEEGFREAADRGQVVLVATFSNACSIGRPEP